MSVGGYSRRICRVKLIEMDITMNNDPQNLLVGYISVELLEVAYS
jgi:hypothetical protein